MNEINNATGLWTAFDYGSTPKYTTGIPGEIFISEDDKYILRKLAGRVAELSKRPIEKEKRKLWFDHNLLKPVRPLVFCDPENGWNEIITEDKIKCSGELAKRWEMVLRKEIFWGESMCDDKVIEPYFDIGYVHTESNWGVEPKMRGGANGGSYVWDAPIKDIGDIDKMHSPKIKVDYKTTDEIFELANKIFGDLLKVRIRGVWWWTLGLTFTLAKLRGLEKIMFDMIDNPEIIHKLMKILRDGTLEKLNFLEENSLLSLNIDSYVGSGGFGYTEELPNKGFDNNRVRTKDMWGFCESQETVGVSPQMFEELVFPYQLPILKRFGLSCYGCCEPLEKRWYLIKKIPNLRRVSVSPWADLEKMAEYLGNKYILSMKPRPTDLAVQVLDEENIRKKIREALKITRGCVVEILMKDNHTIGKNPENVINWVRIVKEEIEKISN